MGVKRRLELVVPCYNESKRLRPEAFLRFVASDLQVEARLVFVDDGSTDTTPTILADLVKRGGGRIAVLTLARNSGKAVAVQSGLLAALERTPDLIGYWDADLATPLDSLAEFLEVLDANPEIDIVMGARVKLAGRQIIRNPLRHYLGRVFATAASLALGAELYDTQCGAKIFRTREPVIHTFRTPFKSEWIFDVEILSRYIGAIGTARSGIYELPLRIWMHMPGSKLGARQVIRAIWDLGVIWRSSSLARRAKSKSR